MPKSDPSHDASRANLTRLSEDLNSLAELVRGLSNSPLPLAFGVAKATLRIAIMKCRIHRALNPDDMPAGDQIPTLAEAAERLAAARGRPRPWLTPAAFEAAADVPEVIGPKTYRKPAPAK